MGREIKFRVWDKQSKKFLKTFSLDDILIMDAATHGDFYEIHQYAGLKDKSGKEIYEGDIIRLTIDDEVSNRLVGAK